MVLPIHARHAYRAGELPLHHRDPFDRMLAAQSLEEGLPLISRDPMFHSLCRRASLVAEANVRCGLPRQAASSLRSYSAK